MSRGAGGVLPASYGFVGREIKMGLCLFAKAVLAVPLESVRTTIEDICHPLQTSVRHHPSSCCICSVYSAFKETLGECFFFEFCTVTWQFRSA